ncbi:MAG: DUF1588 domain-containing protein [Fuerstiella sp.]
MRASRHAAKSEDCPKFHLGWLAAFVAVLTMGADAAWANDALSGDSPLQFNTHVGPFLTAHCIDCHAGDEAEADVSLVRPSLDYADEQSAATWQKVLQVLQFNEMPPPEEERPDPVARANVMRWIEQELAKAGLDETYRSKLLNPEYGNYVNHELLFSGSIQTPPFSPSRLWRFSPQIFGRKRIRQAQSPFSYVTSEHGIRDYAATSGVDQSTIEMILINTNQLLDHWAREGRFKPFEDGQPALPDEKLIEVLRNEFRTAIGRLPSDTEQQKYLTFLKKNMDDGGNLEGLKTTITAMYLSSESIFRMELGLGPVDEHGRRHLSPDELAYAVAYALTDTHPEHHRHIRDAVRQGRLKSKQDVAVLLRTILDDGMNPKQTPRIMRFFEEYFGYNRADKVFKDMSRVQEADIQQWNTNRLMYDVGQLVRYFINRDEDVIAELLTSNRFYVAHTGDNDIAQHYFDEAIREDYVELKIRQKLEHYKRAKRDSERKQEQEELATIRRQAEERSKVVRMAIEDGLTPFPGWPYESVNGKFVRGQGDLIYIAVYNLPPTRRTERQAWNWPLTQPFELPKEQRAGILTHPAWLAAHSVNDGNDPVRRGRWIHEKLLAGVIQDVPPDVDANVPNDPHRTLRERMEPLRAERCWRCHRKMNPLGEPFEIFNDWGQYRTQVYFDQEGKIVHKRGQQFDRWLAEGKLTSRDINATGRIEGSGDPDVDGTVNNAIELLHRLGRSDRARQSFIRHLFRYFMGRNEMLSDSRTLIAAERAYLHNGESFKALVVSLLTSDSFLYRR